MTTEHLNPDTWAVANRALVRKALAEFIHERILEPVATGNGYQLSGGTSQYTFTAKLYPLNHWEVDAASIERFVDGQAAPVDALDFITEFHQQLGIGAEMLPVYLEEISSTLASASYKLSKPDLTASDLVAADFQTIEAAMTEGHPCFVANNGRLGFGATDYRAFAPETGKPCG
ncbi:IucA/IucC family protein [Kribbella antiqua]|uniref:IucA/IucC family protein n=1 Tax=Kribbella antiqua TaxID=2512217 RepID=A0A4R2IRN2_9ACTN|nr:IucA/IucC family protein [Kribbella antiqua]TCO45475.1 IucA/IucC family protein [Kribbella antiqua]